MRSGLAVDPCGVHGLGVVATGCLLPDGVCVLRWHRSYGSTVFHNTIEDPLTVHGQGGETTVQFLGRPSVGSQDPDPQTLASTRP